MGLEAALIGAMLELRATSGSLSEALRQPHSPEREERLNALAANCSREPLLRRNFIEHTGGLVEANIWMPSAAAAAHERQVDVLDVPLAKHFLSEVRR